MWFLYVLHTIWIFVLRKSQTKADEIEASQAQREHIIVYSIFTLVHDSTIHIEHDCRNAHHRTISHKLYEATDISIML